MFDFYLGLLFMVVVFLIRILSPPSGDSPIPASPTAPLEDTQMELSARDVAAILQEANLKTFMVTPPLDLCYDLFCDSETYQVWREKEGKEGRNCYKLCSFDFPPLRECS